MVANLLYLHVEDLLTVAIDSRRLRPELRLDAEKPRGFAWRHLHGPLNLDAVVSVRPFRRRPDGRCARLPAELRHFDCGPPVRFHDQMTVTEAVGFLNLRPRSRCAARPRIRRDGRWPSGSRELRSRGGFGPQVDIHPLVFDQQGNGTKDLGNGSTFTYPAAGLSGAGVIGGREVRCLTPDLQLACHRGYEPDEDDYDDVVALSGVLGVEPRPPIDP